MVETQVSPKVSCVQRYGFGRSLNHWGNVFHGDLSMDEFMANCAIRRSGLIKGGSPRECDLEGYILAPGFSFLSASRLP